MLNSQVQFGDIFSEQILDVVEAEEAVTGVSTATGNAMAASSEGRSLVVENGQELQGAVDARTVVNVAGSMGASGVITTAATGNTSDAGVLGAAATVTSEQVAGPVEVTGVSQLEAAEAYVNDLTQSTQAIANSQGVAATSGDLQATVNQTSEANVLADGGAIVGTASGSVLVSGNAAGNNLTAVGVEDSTVTVNAAQTNLADSVQASKFTAFGESLNTVTSATATGNNLHATNEGGLLDVTSEQANTAYIRAQAEGTTASFSSAQVQAFGSGNSVLAGVFGPEVALSNVQLNSGGGVEVIAVGDVGAGWDVSTVANATGNSVTAYSCATCTGRMTIDNNQTNSADVAARTTSRTGYGRSVTGISTAIGNNASFYVTAPGSADGDEE